ncbi:MAG: 2,3-bisphosphoglycerate-independent phosphoglycerate mutase [Candidatus Dormibacteraeota bacterium]|nr:2,3-bisphosphoglycerate-independent phosphoglycerate mutase [Candidatus Dormibacteraeota bacterium]MBV9525259.1 2,3-bisphosphoglycerate-independent phosphoglycerate mutase [Candidatus Dormibacteraeota bacterium]
MSAHPFVLVILDGWGFNPDRFGNAIAQAGTPQIDALTRRWPNTLVAASGEAVGLPRGQQGNSEVGHLTIGAGRVIHQPLSRINRAIADGSFYSNAVLCAAVDATAARGAALHCLGLVSPGGVHSHQDHAIALAELARRRGLDRVFFHAFTDGRDEPPTSAAGFVQTFCDDLQRVGVGRVASLSGRYFAMDRDKRWDRTRRAYEVIAGAGEGVAGDPVAYIESQYALDVTDEFLPPVSILVDGEPIRVQDGDTVVFFNFRPDRARQLSHALVDPDFGAFERSRVPRDLTFVTFTEYERGLPAAVAFPREDVHHTLAEVVSEQGLHQFHVAETEKYAHVTYFINGGRERAFPLEERLLVPSQRVATYDSVPDMSARPVTEAVLDHVRKQADALIIVNFANADMVGHTGDFEATVRAVMCVDECVGRIADAVLRAGGAVLVTADHGNAELKVDHRDGSPLTAHTTSPVPVILCGAGEAPLRDGGGLRDVAPTVLAVMGLPVPAEMTGAPLQRLSQRVLT